MTAVIVVQNKNLVLLIEAHPIISSSISRMRFFFKIPSGISTSLCCTFLYFFHNPAC